MFGYSFQQVFHRSALFEAFGRVYGSKKHAAHVRTGLF